MTGPLAGVRIIEIESIGPGPFAGMVLADLGAEVIRIERVRGETRHEPAGDPTLRGRRFIALDLKQAAGAEAARRLIDRADGLIEGFRPGVMESLGLGPDDVRDRNRRLVYGRMTGWGQKGPLATAAGHDINYIALGGVLAHLGSPDAPPSPPLNLIGDYGGGGMLLALGMVAGLFEARGSGEGQVVDAAMVDGAALLMTAVHGLRARDSWNDERGSNILDGGAPFYRTYETLDGRYLAVGPVERRFHQVFVDRAGLPDDLVAERMTVEAWPEQRATVQQMIGSRTLAEWCEVFEGSDACVAPVLTMAEAAEHPHNRARGTFVAVDGVVQPAPAPRFSRTPSELPASRPATDDDTDVILRELGYSDHDIEELRRRHIAQ